MKKTVSINIGGIIFHIEEDGFEKLKKYLETVNTYFAKFDDSSEIISDIEGRIAELFLIKLSDGRQTLNEEDVKDLIATMGTTQDFEASIEDDVEDDQPQSKTSEEKKEEQDVNEPEPSEPKRLYRDTKRGILGGVASGIAHYLAIDPLWIRLLFLALFINVFFAGLSGAIFIGYIIMWIATPPNGALQENSKVKKLYRNVSDRVLGGVSAGIAAYFGTDVVVIRVLFVVSIFAGGSGILAYIILWIITPAANTITEKMQMSGKPVTLKNIEDNVKKNFKVKEGEESPWMKILLFPFRLVSILITAIGKVLGPLLRFLVDVIRIVFGAFLMFLGFAFVAGLLALALSALGLGGLDTSIVHSDLPLEQILQSINLWVVLSVFLLSFIPSIGLTLLGLMIIVRKSIINSFIGWALFALWILGILLAAFTIPKFIGEFHETNTVKDEITFASTQATPTLYLNDVGHDIFDGVDLRLRGHSDSTFTALIRTESRGTSKEEATENARLAQYNIEKDGEDFTFDSNITFDADAQYRFQDVDATFYIPYGKVFRIDEELTEILTNTLRNYGYRNYQVRDNEWVFLKNGELSCVTCESEYYDKEDSEDDDSHTHIELKTHSSPDEDELSYPFENFDEIKIGALLDIEISKSQDESYSVLVKGDENDLDNVYLNQVGDRLEVKFKNDRWKSKDYERMKLIIKVPHLEELEIYGACEGEIVGFDEEKMSIEISGESEIYMRADVKNLEIKLSGDSELDLIGEGESTEVEVSGSSQFKGLNYESDELLVETNGASRAEVYGKMSIRANASKMSTIKYRGSGGMDLDRDGSGRIERY